MSRRDEFNQHAASTPLDNTTIDCLDTAETVQEGFEEMCIKLGNINNTSTPGFSFGRSSNVNNGTWLLCETVPSNKAGRYVYINNAVIETVFVGSETISTYDLEIYAHDGDSVNLALLGTVSIVSSRGGAFSLGQAVATNKHLAIKLVNGSARNIVAGLELSGTD